MKFRAVVHNQQYMKEIQNIILTFAKISKEVVCILDTDRVTFSVCESQVQKIPKVWSVIEKKSGYFSEYSMEGYNKETHNKIFLTFNPVKMASALSTLNRSSVRYIKIKLTDNQFPCLSVHVEVISINSVQNRQIIHDVPITIIPTRDWDEFDLPKLPLFKTMLKMPSLKSLRTLMDKIKNLSPIVTFFQTGCNQVLDNCELSLVVETDLTTVASHYKNLSCVENPNAANVSDANNETEVDEEVNAGHQEVSCRVNSKLLAAFFSSNQILNCHMYCNIKSNSFFSIFIEISEGVSMSCLLYTMSM